LAGQRTQLDHWFVEHREPVGPSVLGRASKRPFAASGKGSAGGIQRTRCFQWDSWSARRVREGEPFWTQARGRHLGRPATSPRIVSEIEALATSTGLSIRAIQKRIAGRASRGIVGEITKRARAVQLSAL